MQEKQHCKMFITNPDLKWADKYILPRMSGQLPFVLALASFSYLLHTCVGIDQNGFFDAL